ncbi:hypothetical protein [Burkholderia vietnamiensis]|nr:hypothetical protein [Burkholderia vietnamiensis]MCA7984884.1 hypothetical protein [Burkholderia vietnamiensis]HDR8930518.1 hypothetical protein [Burkholderia vietnamiensis]HDR9062205.1 hypothetical protein [Burkholderia vietnamiensis]
MALIACFLWIWSTVLAALLGLAGTILMLPGRLLVWISDAMLDALGDD